MVERVKEEILAAQKRQKYMYPHQRKIIDELNAKLQAKIELPDLTSTDFNEIGTILLQAFT
jgi:hypothetical protein